MNWRKPAYLFYASLRGYRFPSLLRRYLAEYEAGMRIEGLTMMLVPSDLVPEVRRLIGQRRGA